MCFKIILGLVKPVLSINLDIHHSKVFSSVYIYIFIYIKYIQYTYPVYIYQSIYPSYIQYIYPVYIQYIFLVYMRNINIKKNNGMGIEVYVNHAF